MHIAHTQDEIIRSLGPLCDAIFLLNSFFLKIVMHLPMVFAAAFFDYLAIPGFEAGTSVVFVCISFFFYLLKDISILIFFFRHRSQTSAYSFCYILSLGPHLFGISNFLATTFASH